MITQEVDGSGFLITPVDNVKLLTMVVDLITHIRWELSCLDPEQLELPEPLVPVSDELSCPSGRDLHLVSWWLRQVTRKYNTLNLMISQVVFLNPLLGWGVLT